MRNAAAFLFFSSILVGTSAFAENGGDAATWLQRAAQAARQLNYTGTIMYQNGSRVETSRLLHYVDANGETEKLVSLDGPPREVIRNNDQVTCYLPDTKNQRIDPRPRRDAFPSFFPAQVVALSQFYEVKKAEVARVAGLEAQAYVFEPRDGLRYAHKFWVDTASGLLLKARMVDERNELIEQFAFIDVQVNAKIDRDQLKPMYPHKLAEWQVQKNAPPAPLQEIGWEIRQLPPGFTKIKESYRVFSGRPEPVVHMVFSDGLVAVSVFIEPLSGPPPQQGLVRVGGINTFTRQLADHRVTVLGQAPDATVVQIANAVARVRAEQRR